MRFAAIVLAAVTSTAVLVLGCSPSDEPAEPTTTTAAPPRPTATTAAPTGTTGPTATSGTATATGTSASAQTISVTVAGGSVTPPPSAPVDVRLGSTVVIQVAADVADQVLVPGYDQRAQVQPNQPARLELVANVPGQFEVGLENARLLLLTLRVG